jgi:DNA-binding CsgD family transcriptional regulator/tetratricopeptide (TPR) repeat protein
VSHGQGENDLVVLPRRLREAGVTRREAEVLQAISQRLANAEIARRLFVSKRTVESHVASLLRKLGVSSRAGLIEVGLSLGVGVSGNLPPALSPVAGVDTPFVGRGTELALADELLAGGRERLALLWLLGEPGIGKTRLAAEMARRAYTDGAIVLFGRCDEDLRVPYQPFLEALRWLVDQNDELPSRLGEFSEDLGAVLRGRLPESEIDQYRFFEAVRYCLAAAGGGRPLLLVLDDLHWATTPTLQLLGHLARDASPSPAMFVCTVRDTSPDGNEALAKLMEELDRRGVGSHRLELRGLDVAGVEELVEHRRDLDPPAVAAALHQETGGNPLFIQALLTWEAWRPGELPRSVAETVERRVARLPRHVGDVLRTAAVAGLEFEVPVVARASGDDELTTVEALETALSAGLVEETEADRYRFAHALVRSALRAGLSRSRRARVHLRVAEAIEAVGDVDEQASALAYHFSHAAPVAAGTRAFHYTLFAAERAARLLSHAEAADAYGRALDLLGRAGAEAPPRHDLLVARGEAQRRAGNFSGALATLRTAVEEASANEAAEQAARAAISFEETSLWLGSSGTVAVTLLERAAESLPAGDTPIRALTVAAISRALQFSGAQAESIARGEEAVAIAERVGDPATTVRVLARVNVPYQYVAEAPVAAARWSEVTRRAREVSDDLVLNHALGMSLWALAQLGDLSAFDQVFAEFADLSGKLRLGGWEHFSDLFRSLRAFLAGDLAGAERFLDRAHDTGVSLGLSREGLYGVAMFLIRREQGRLGEVLPAVRQLAAFSPAAVWRPGRAALYAELGLLTEARAEFDDLAEAEFSDLPTDGSRDLCIGLLAEVCAALGDAGRAPLLTEHLLGCQGRLLVFVGTSACLGPADRLLAMLASTAGRHEDAERWYRRALELSGRVQSPLWIARTLCDYGRHLLPSDPSGGKRMLAEAAEISEEHDLVGVGQLIERLLA